MKKALLLIILSFMTNAQAKANLPHAVERVYIDKNSNVHIILNNKKNVKLTNNGHTANATLAPDKRTVAWVKLNSWIAEGDIEPQASQLGVYRNGKIRYIECGPFIRDYWFWMQGNQIATDCGGRHFAGTLTLYDTDTLREVESFFQPDVPEDKRPAWSKSGSNANHEGTAKYRRSCAGAPHRPYIQRLSMDSRLRGNDLLEAFRGAQ